MMTTLTGIFPRRPLHRVRGFIAVSCLALALAACSTGPGGVVGTVGGASQGKVPPVRQPSRAQPRDPAVQSVPGLEGVIGTSQKQLVRQFGPPRLDVWEGDARKLQFTGAACVLDIYLYPTSSSREPLATFVDARRSSDGRDVDRAACVAALRRP
jgi:hypothetical protein